MSVNTQHALVENVLFTRWSTPPSPEDVTALSEHLQRVHQQLGRPFVYVTSVPPSAPLPNADQRKRLNDILLECRKHCPFICLVLEGDELRRNLQQVVIRGMALFTRSQPNFLRFLHDSELVAAEVSQHTGLDGKHILRKARATGIIS